MKKSNPSVLSSGADDSLNRLTPTGAVAKAKDELVDVDCLDQADDALTEELAVIVSKPPCPLIDDSDKYKDQVDTFVGGVTAGDPCAAKLKGSAKLGSKALKCQATKSKKGAPAVATCNEKAESKLDKSFDKADQKGCMPIGGADDVKDKADDLVDGAAGVLLFDAGQQANGAFGNRAATDAICIAAANAQFLGCGSVVALLSYTGDQVSDFPTSKNVPASAPITAGTERIADNWADFLDGSWATCLGSECDFGGPTGAGIVSGPRVFTGTDNDGTVSANCDEWTDADAPNAAAINDSCYGTSYEEPDFAVCTAGRTFDSETDTLSCDSPSSFLCLCY